MSTTVGAPGFLAAAVGETIHHPLLLGPSPGRLSALDVHDAGRGCRGRQSLERVAGSATSGVALPMEGQTVAQRNRLRAATPAAPALAYRCFLYQRERHVLLPVQHSGWLQPFDRPLGFAGIDDRSGNRSHLATSRS